MEIGAEWLVDASGCTSEAPTESRILPALLHPLLHHPAPRPPRALFGAATHAPALHPVPEPLFHQFPKPGGITGFVILSESHLACHTYPEHGVITIDRKSVV